MTKDMSTILFCANILTEARYVGTLFQSCQNRLLYPTLQIYLPSLQKTVLTVNIRDSHNLHTSRRILQIVVETQVKKRDPNKLGTRNKGQHACKYIHGLHIHSAFSMCRIAPVYA